MLETTKKNLKNTDVWIRVVFMILFSFIYGVAIIVFWTVVVLQVLFTLFTTEQNQKIFPFSKQLTSFLYEILLYLTYHKDEKPFPFGDWPKQFYEINCTEKINKKIFYRVVVKKYKTIKHNYFYPNNILIDRKV